MKIFAVIVTYNSMQWIDRCLNSLAKSSLPVISVVVDNNSKDDTVSHIKSNYPEVVLFEEKSNHGFGQANNIGLRYAIGNGADYVLLLNQDAWIDCDVLAKLIEFDDGKTVLSPVHLNGAHDALDRNFCRASVVRSGYGSLLDGDALLASASGLHPAREICAACWLIPRAILDRIGGFNPLFFHYNEDNNYQYRLFFHGCRIAWVGGVYVCHDREYRKYQPVKYSKVRQELLLRSSNISTTRLVGHLRQWRYALGVVHEAIRMREPQAVWFLLRAAYDITFRMHGEVAESRRKEKKIQNNWL